MGSETMEAYRAKVRERLEKNAATRSRNETENAILTEIAKGAKAEIPDALISRQEDISLRNMEYNLMYQGIKLDDYLKYIGSTREEYKKNFEEEAKTSVMHQLILEKIIKLENITASEEEINAKVEEQGKSVGKSADEYKKTIDPRQLDYIENDIKVTKLFAFLEANNEMVAYKEEKPKSAPKKKAEGEKEAKSDAAEKPAAAKKPAAKKTVHAEPQIKPVVKKSAAAKKKED